MAPKRSQNKPWKVANPDGEAGEMEWAALRRSNIVFKPMLEEHDLVERYAIMWGKDTKAHSAPDVLPGSVQPSDDKYPFFVAYFYCRLVPPFTEFFCKIMYMYGFHLLDFTPNAMTRLAVFTHFCENFVGVMPSAALFRHYFIPRIEADTLSGCIAWIPRDGDAYLLGPFNREWSEWRREWCWIKDDKFPDFCKLRTVGSKVCLEGGD
jgi:hypothetical protein